MFMLAEQVNDMRISGEPGIFTLKNSAKLASDITGTGSYWLTVTRLLFS